MTTLRDALSEALTQSEAGTLQAPVERAIETDSAPAVETEQTESDRLRDEAGRFSKNEKSEAPPNKTNEVVPAAQKATPAPAEGRKPPSSWKKDYWQHWDKLGKDPELSKLQEYIEQREGEFTKGVSAYKSQWDQAAPLYEAMQPFMPELQRFGIEPREWITNLGNAHRTLAMGSPEQKLQMFAKLATDYGVPLQALNNQPSDPQAGYVTQTVAQLQKQWQEFQTQLKTQQNSRLLSEIEAFKQDAPYFEDVRETMAQLLGSGVAADLKSAYEKAIRLNDDVWQRHQAQQAKNAEADRQSQIARKKAAAVSPRSSSPTGAVSAGNTKKSLRDSLSEQYDSVTSGHF